jgi:hypothetical protein
LQPEYLKFRDFVFERQFKQQEAVRKETEAIKIAVQKSCSSQKLDPLLSEKITS